MRVTDLVLVLIGLAAGGVGLHRALRSDPLSMELQHTLNANAMVQPFMEEVDSDTLSAESLAALLEVTVEGNVFRRARTPSPVELLDGESTAASVASAVRPLLRLVGIVGGPPWSAIVEGIPGRDGPSLVSQNDSAGELRVSAVDSTHVRIVGRDTVWVLALNRGIP